MLERKRAPERWLGVVAALAALSLLATLMVFSTSWALETLHLLLSSPSPARLLELLAALACMCVSALLFLLDFIAILWLTGQP
jgi:TRAP-type C4-dicarboxylate transport system permease small subunit